jgi:hypothetical protein
MHRIFFSSFPQSPGCRLLQRRLAQESTGFSLAESSHAHSVMLDRFPLQPDKRSDIMTFDRGAADS